MPSNPGKGQGCRSAVYSVDALRKVPYDRLSSAHHFDTEMLILFAERGLRIRELPIPTHYGSEKSYVNTGSTA